MKKDYDIELLLKERNVSKDIHLKRLLIIILFFDIIAFTIVCIIVFPKIELMGDEIMKIEYPEEYHDPGYEARTLTKSLNKKVKIKGVVDPNKIGNYEINYEVKNGIFTSKKKRIVQVVDTQNPDLILTGDEIVNVCPNSDYQEEGYKAIDNYDGDITNKVEVFREDNVLIYEVEDSSHNKTKRERKLSFKDEIKPNIELLGSQTMYITVNESFEDPGVKAFDNCDKDITEQVKKEGTVNTSQKGTYEIVYKISDSSGNENKITRTVVVQNKVPTSSSCSKVGAIYLTFDDGPMNGTTEKILDVLKEENVKATFFITSSGPDSLIWREYNEGHSVALHTYSHDYAYIYSSVDNYFSDLNEISNRVKRITGKETRIIRFPGGSSNTISRRYQEGIMSALTNQVLEREYHYYDWNVDSGDAGSCASTNPTASCVYKNIVNGLSKNRCNMVLMHDVKSYTADAIKDVIHYGKENGYTFEKIDSTTPMVRQKVNN